jgi:hypothetical protein
MRCVCADAHLAVRPAHELGGVRLARGILALEQADQLVSRPDLLVEDLRLLEEGHDVVPALRPQRRRPALVLLEQPGVALPAVVGQLEGAAGVVGHLHALELVAEQDVLELGLLLDVALGAAVLDLVERRLGDVDVAGLDELRHLAEDQRQHERPDVRAVHVGVGHDDDLVVAR